MNMLRRNYIFIKCCHASTNQRMLNAIWCSSMHHCVCVCLWMWAVIQNRTIPHKQDECLQSTATFDGRRITWVFSAIGSRCVVSLLICIKMNSALICIKFNFVMVSGTPTSNHQSPSHLKSPNETEWLPFDFANCGWSECNFSVDRKRILLESGMLSEVTVLYWIKPWVFLDKILSTQKAVPVAFSWKRTIRVLPQ